jgi:hypothetical protein
VDAAIEFGGTYYLTYQLYPAGATLPGVSQARKRSKEAFTIQAVFSSKFYEVWACSGMTGARRVGGRRIGGQEGLLVLLLCLPPSAAGSATSRPTPARSSKAGAHVVFAHRGFGNHA